MTNKSEQAIERVNEVETRFARSPVWKALVDGGLSLIPGLGQAISSAVSTRAANLAERRTAALIEQLRVSIGTLEAKTLDAAFLDSDEFTSILIRTLELNARTAREEKVSLFAAVFLGFTRPPGSLLPFKEGFLRLVDELEPEHVDVFGIIHRESGPDRTPGRAGRARVELIAPELGIAQGRVLAYGVQMMRFGLVQDDSIGRAGYTPGRWVITAYGCEFVEHLGTGGGDG